MWCLGKGCLSFHADLFKGLVEIQPPQLIPLTIQAGNIVQNGKGREGKGRRDFN